MPSNAGHAPFLLLSIRAEDAAADDEDAAMMRFAGLDGNGLHRIRLTPGALGQNGLADWPGIILGGGPYNVSDAADSKSETQRRVESELLPLIGRIADRDFPFLGCCYGVGTLGSVVGATVDRTWSEPVGAMTIILTERGRRDPLFADLPDVFDAYAAIKREPVRCPRIWSASRTRPTAPSRPSALATTSMRRSFTPSSPPTGSAPA